MKDATFSQALHLLQLVEDRQLSLERLQKHYDKGLLSDLLECEPEQVDREEYRKVINLPPLILTPVITEYPEMEVDYTRTRDEMIAAGTYDWENPDIRKYWPEIKREGGGKVSDKPFLFHFNRRISSEAAVIEMDAAGYRAGTDAEILAFGEKNPKVQLEFPVIGLGSVAVVDGSREVLFLDGHDSERVLSLHWFVDVWLARCRFLAFRKSSGA